MHNPAEPLEMMIALRVPSGDSFKGPPGDEPKLLIDVAQLSNGYPLKDPDCITYI